MPDRITLQNDVLIFVKNFGEKKYFTSVTQDDGN